MVFPKIVLFYYFSSGVFQTFSFFIKLNYSKFSFKLSKDYGKSASEKLGEDMKGPKIFRYKNTRVVVKSTSFHPVCPPAITTMMMIILPGSLCGYHSLPTDRVRTDGLRIVRLVVQTGRTVRENWMFIEHFNLTQYFSRNGRSKNR